MGLVTKNMILMPGSGGGVDEGSHAQLMRGVMMLHRWGQRQMDQWCQSATLDIGHRIIEFLSATKLILYQVPLVSLVCWVNNGLSTMFVAAQGKTK